MARKSKYQQSSVNYYKGLWAERLAAVWLVVKGYRIVAMRYKTKVGEIDIVARKKDIIVFVEVKAYKTQEKGALAISNVSKGRIFRAGQFFLAKNPKWSGLNVRFDAMMVQNLVKITHLKNAWTENDCIFK